VTQQGGAVDQALVTEKHRQAKFLLSQFDDVPDSVDNAIRLLHQVTEADPRLVAAWNDMGVAYLKKEEPDSAKSIFEKAIEVDPTFVMGHSNLGFVWETEYRDYAKAEFEYREAMRLDPTALHPVNDLAFMFLDQKKPRLAQEVLRTAVERFPKEAAIWAKYGKVSLQLGEFESAATALQEALKLDPSRRDVIQLKNDVDSVRTASQ